MHLKRQVMPKTWPVPRKLKKSRYVAVASHAKAKGISLLMLLRDILKIGKTKKEIKQIILKGDVKVNNEKRTNVNFPVQVFDVINIEKLNKNYRLNIVNRKFKLEEVSGQDVDLKIVKIIGKKILGKDKTQMNLEDGQNFNVKEKFKVGDSALINTKEKKIVKIIPFAEGAKVEIISGKHAGEEGVLKEIEKLTRGKKYLIKLKEKEVELPGKTLLVVE